MTISSSLAAGVAGLNANANKLASISDNIANSATYGYKRNQTDFHSMVVDSGGGATYTAGGVRSTTNRLIDERGAIEGSKNPTDIAINGRGFLPVTDLAAIEGTGALPLSLMTTGSFRPNDEGILTTSTGQVLMGWPANEENAFPAFPRDSAAGLKPINVFHNQFAANPTTEMTVGVNLPSDDSDPAALGGPHDLTLEYFGNLGQTESLTMTFAPTGTEHEWTLEIADSASGGAVVAEYTLTFNSGVNNGGTLRNAVPNIAGLDYDNEAGTIEIPVAGTTIFMDIGRPGATNGLTQLDSSFAPSNIAKNGSTVGNLKEVEINPKGILVAVYDSGFTRPIYQVPIIDVSNPNGLTAGDSQTYKLSLDSGPMFLWDAGTGPVGETSGYSREASTTDVAQELTSLIQTQRAYSSNAKIIQTVDEMLQETTNLKR